MAFQANPINLQALQDALVSQDIPTVAAFLNTLPVKLPQVNNPSVLVSTLTTVQSATDAIIQALHPTKPFRSVYFASHTLLAANVPRTLFQLLRTFLPHQPLINRLSDLVAYLVIDEPARTSIGEAGVAKQLAILYSRNPTSVPLIRALIALASGHLDNTAEIINQNALPAATNVLTNTAFTKHNVNILQATTRLITSLAIYAPDEKDDRKSLIPALLSKLNQATQNRSPQLVANLLSAIATAADCVHKDGDGYVFDDPSNIFAAVLDAWTAFRSNASVSFAAPWTIVALAHIDDNSRNALNTNAEKVRALLDTHNKLDRTSAFLAEMLVKPRLRKPPGKRGISVGKPPKQHAPAQSPLPFAGLSAIECEIAASPIRSEDIDPSSSSPRTPAVQLRPYARATRRSPRNAVERTEQEFELLSTPVTPPSPQCDSNASMYGEEVEQADTNNCMGDDDVDNDSVVFVKEEKTTPSTRRAKSKKTAQKHSRTIKEKTELRKSELAPKSSVVYIVNEDEDEVPAGLQNCGRSHAHLFTYSSSLGSEDSIASSVDDEKNHESNWDASAPCLNVENAKAHDNEPYHLRSHALTEDEDTRGSMDMPGSSDAEDTADDETDGNSKQTNSLGVLREYMDNPGCTDLDDHKTTLREEVKSRIQASRKRKQRVDIATRAEQYKRARNEPTTTTFSSGSSSGAPFGARRRTTRHSKMRGAMSQAR